MAFSKIVHSIPTSGKRTSLVALLVAVFAVLWSAPAAQADPHAMFYTTVGQQQLFFNVLAALDQADYVEPKAERDKLLTLRNAAIDKAVQAAGLKLGADVVRPQDDPITKETQTDLAGLVTRSITLDGSDQYTSQINRDHAREVARRAGTTDLLQRAYCEALGRKDCSDTNGDLYKDRGFINDPLRWGHFYFSSGVLGTLLSGTDEHTEEYKRVKDSKQLELGYLSDTNIEELQEKTSGEAEKSLNEDLVNTALSFLPAPVKPDLYDDVTFDQNGNLEITKKASDADYAEWYDRKLNDFLFHPLALQETAEAGGEAIKSIAEQVEEQGEVAAVQLRPRAEVPEVCNNGQCPPPDPASAKGLWLQPVIEVSAPARLAQVDASAQALADLNTNLADAPTSLVEAPSGTTDLLGVGEVAGVSTDQAAEGKVLSAIVPTKKFGQAAPLGSIQKLPHQEGDLGHVLEAFVPGHATDTRCGCGLEVVANEFGTAIMVKLKSFSR